MAAVGPASPVLAQQTPPPTAGQAKQQPQASPSPQKPEPPPNIPLFPRYRRGLYKNGHGLWVIDGPPQSPPLFTDDPGVPDKGVYEINFTTSADLATSAKAVDYLRVDANYGLLPKMFGREVPIQLKLEGPVSAANVEGQTLQAGLGTFAVGAKVNLYSNDNQAVELSVYPQLEFGTGSTFVDKGLVERGQTIVLPALVSKQFHYVTLIFNGGIETPINDPDRLTVGTAGASVGMAVRRHVALMMEIRYESPFQSRDGRMALANVGAMLAVGHYAVLYGNLGRTVWSSDGEAHVFVGGGLKILIAPDRSR